MVRPTLRRRVGTIYALTLIGSLWGAARAEETPWRVRYPREEIAPRAWRDEEVRFKTKSTLALAGKGQRSVHGSWTRDLPVAPNAWFRFEVHYRARAVEEPLRCVLARILWKDSRDRQVGRAEYPATVLERSPDDWSVIRQTYEVPAGVTNAVIELVLRWDADGVVHFSEPTLEKVPPPPPRKVRLASVHHRPRNSKGARDNLESYAKLVAAAAERRADVVCLPEGITVVGTGKSFVEVSEPVPGPSTQFLGAVAREHRLYIVAGIYERDGAAVYNTAVLIGRTGELVGKYRKVCLPREEIEGGITPGERLPVFRTDFGRVGLMICWDVFFPEPARMLARQGAEVIFLPIWGGNLTLARARAIENQVHIVSSTYDMKTAVFDQEGNVLSEGTEAHPVIVVEVDLGQRKVWPWLGDFRSRIPRERPTQKALELGD